MTGERIRNQRVLTTGGAGFIGSELVRQLAEQGAEVIVVDNLVNGRRENLAGLLDGRVRLEVADIRERERMAQLMNGVDIVYHLACLGVRHSIHSPEENHEVNASGTLQLLQAARAAGVGRFVYVSTSEVYGTARWVPMSEEHPTVPMTMYGASKLAGESYARAFHRTYGYPTVVVRPFNAYGPRCHHEGDSGEVIPKFLLRCMAGQPMVVFGDGTQTRDFTYVSDTAEGILRAGCTGEAIGQTINLGSGFEISVKDLAQEMRAVVGRPDAQILHDAPRPGDVLRLCADSGRANRLLDFAPRVPFSIGLARLRDWYRSLDRSVETLLVEETVHNWKGRHPAAQPTERAFIPVAKPLLGQAEVDAVGRPLRCGWVTQGPEVAAFEREFAAFVGARHACATSSCTTALHLALLAVGVRPGDEVVTASHSFIATANAVRYCGATPVFVDIEPGTFNMDPVLLDDAITERTRALLCVHQIGMPCDLHAILEVARRRSLPVVEDAACAIGSEILWDGQWQRIGRPHGDIACFSFHPRKLVTTGDGGMITTSNPEWDRQLRLWRHHGMSVPDAVRHGSRQVIRESYVDLGFNFRLTDIQAAVGRAQLRRLPEILSRRRELVGRYRCLLEGIPGVRLPEEPEWARTNWQSYCVRLPEGVDQRTIMQAMLEAGVATRRGVMCAHREPAYPRGTWSCGPQTFPCACPPGTCRRLAQSERAQDHAIILPLYDQMTAGDQDAVARALEDACRRVRA